MFPLPYRKLKMPGTTLELHWAWRAWLYPYYLVNPLACAANVEQNRWDIGIGLPREPPDSHRKGMRLSPSWGKKQTGHLGQVVLKGIKLATLRKKSHVFCLPMSCGPVQFFGVKNTKDCGVLGAELDSSNIYDPWLNSSLWRLTTWKTNKKTIVKNTMQIINIIIVLDLTLQW